jgi:hypothetical protein
MHHGTTKLYVSSIYIQEHKVRKEDTENSERFVLTFVNLRDFFVVFVQWI